MKKQSQQKQSKSKTFKATAIRPTRLLGEVAKRIAREFVLSSRSREK